jgi:hypothetical protein
VCKSRARCLGVWRRVMCVRPHDQRPAAIEDMTCRYFISAARIWHVTGLNVRPGTGFCAALACHRASSSSSHPRLCIQVTSLRRSQHEDRTATHLRMSRQRGSTCRIQTRFMLRMCTSRQRMTRQRMLGMQGNLPETLSIHILQAPISWMLPVIKHTPFRPPFRVAVDVTTASSAAQEVPHLQPHVITEQDVASSALLATLHLQALNTIRMPLPEAHTCSVSRVQSPTCWGRGARC